MTYNPDKHHRRSIRLRGYDYCAVGAYWVTICTHDRACLFGEVVDREVRLNDAGKVVKRCWIDIPSHFPHTELDKFVIMPNHVHGILFLNNLSVGAKNFSPLQTSGTSKTIGSIVRGFKIGVTKWMRQNTNIQTVWQRNYFERILRNDKELDIRRGYIENNPFNWNDDEYNTLNQNSPVSKMEITDPGGNCFPDENGYACSTSTERGMKTKENNKSASTKSLPETGDN